MLSLTDYDTLLTNSLDAKGSETSSAGCKVSLTPVCKVRRAWSLRQNACPHRSKVHGEMRRDGCFLPLRPTLSLTPPILALPIGHPQTGNLAVQLSFPAKLVSHCFTETNAHRSIESCHPISGAPRCYVHFSDTNPQNKNNDSRQQFIPTHSC
jgi:hypothetical protein